MIGTHDSLTYLPAKNPLFELFSFLWRTQTKNIFTQKIEGVNYFDIRIRRYNGRWIVCHGIVDFDFWFESIIDILESFMPHKVRIILERGNKKDETLFKKEIEEATNYFNLSFACIKKRWVVLLDNDPNIYDYTYRPWLSNLSFWDNIKRFNFFSTIKRYAKKHNPKITNELRQDTENIYFMDYV